MLAATLHAQARNEAAEHWPSRAGRRCSHQVDGGSGALRRAMLHSGGGSRAVQPMKGADEVGGVPAEPRGGAQACSPFGWQPMAGAQPTQGLGRASSQAGGLETKVERARRRCPGLNGPHRERQRAGVPQACCPCCACAGDRPAPAVHAAHPLEREAAALGNVGTAGGPPSQLLVQLLAGLPHPPHVCRKRRAPEGSQKDQSPSPARPPCLRKGEHKGGGTATTPQHAAKVLGWARRLDVWQQGTELRRRSCRAGRRAHRSTGAQGAARHAHGCAPRVALPAAGRGVEGGRAGSRVVGLARRGHAAMPRSWQPARSVLGT